MGASFYFYDLETSGFDARSARIMQFAGQRTDMQLRPIAEPDNILIKLTNDVLPDPDAVLVTGITPQATLMDGITEAEFLQYFAKHIAVPDTIFVGYNNVRFDDEFVRYLHYRNFYDPYEWCWKDGCSRWDMLDVVRMTRALRPDGIEWPFSPDGKPANRLELLTAVNKLEHEHAHDALSDVHATIAVARLIRNKQPKLFEYMLSMRGKNEVKKLVESSPMFVYASGKYANAYQKTTVVTVLGEHPGKQGVLVYDLRRDPEEFVDLMPEEIVAAWTTWSEDDTQRFPVKTLQFNRCPAVAPLSVLDRQSQERLKLDMETVQLHAKKLKQHPDFYTKLLDALQRMDKQRQTGLVGSVAPVDARLYDGFFDNKDKTAMSVVRAADRDEIASLEIKFEDARLNELLPLYKARNFIETLTNEEREQWESYRKQVLLGGGISSRAHKFFARLSELAARPDLTKDEQFLLQELQLYGESILPVGDE